MSSRHDRGWDRIYHHYRPKWLPWELGKPRGVLVELVDSGRVVPGISLDLCCGAGTNPIYLAKKGFEVTALDISDGAVKYARERAYESEVDINFLVGNFWSLPFRDKEFDFAFDFGCFHHVEVNHRMTFIKGVYRVLRPKGTYLLVCFSYKNGPSWNHFRKEQILELFRDYFRIEWIKHFSSLEADNVTRYFFEVLMERLNIEKG
jgi:ubiquinone/menaquinone biosynthesis C-methylase UbiE